MYLPPASDQPDSYSCVPSADGDAVDQATGGIRHPSVKAIRASVGSAWNAPMSYVEMTEANPKTAGIASWAKYSVATTDALQIVEAGHPTLWSIDTNVTAPYPDVRTGSFRGGHTILVPAGGYTVFQPDGDRCTCEKHITTRHGEYTYQDPGTYSVGYRRISAALLYKAALARADNGGVNILVLPDVTNVRRKVVKGGYIREKPTTASHTRGRRETGDIVTLVQPVRGSRWTRSDGSYSTCWWEMVDDRGYLRGDKLGRVNL